MLKPLLINQEGAFLLPKGGGGGGFEKRYGRCRHRQVKEENDKTLDEPSWKILVEI
jgi:hypothetical protein